MRRWLISLAICLLPYAAPAAESQAAFAARLHQHVSAIGYDRIVNQSANRSGVKIISVRFSLSPEGRVTDVKILSSPMSWELNGYFVRAFKNLPPLSNMPKDRPKFFEVKVAIGG